MFVIDHCKDERNHPRGHPSAGWCKCGHPHPVMACLTLGCRTCNQQTNTDRHEMAALKAEIDHLVGKLKKLEAKGRK